VAVNSIYASIIPSYKYNLVLKSFSYGTQVMGHPVLSDICRSFLRVSKVTEKIKTPSKPTPNENFTQKYYCQTDTN
jgi:hypothetical protein